ncbi:MAG: glutamate-5-semialdehyde dehydrogenase [Oscillospiraceae bacterium]|jgi:glutamate-5-semialdehyde dehydrogenase|nr:glutamate-5-semialdehyde dehydrogenase [Oscillospiraceae bacterium]
MLEQIGKQAKAAARILAGADTKQKNRALETMAAAVLSDAGAILSANAADMAAAEARGMNDTMLDRLRLTQERLEGVAQGIRDIAALPDPVGRILSDEVRPNGLRLVKTAVPIGVIAVIYEARPNVTADSAALCLKSGNAVILRGGKEAIRSNTALAETMRRALNNAGLPADCIQLVTDTTHESANELMRMNAYVDVLIPRGSRRLIRATVEQSTVPVIETGSGVCHIYVDKAADLEMAADIIENAKTSRPSVCNAAECMLIHREVAEKLLPIVARRLEAKHTVIRGDKEVMAILGPRATPATDEDWGKEYLDYIIAAHIVGSIDEAIDYVYRYSTGHSECIVTEDPAAAELYLTAVDAAAVYHNASTRFTDGGEFGLGAEIGISTQKLHARGPLGLNELTSMKFKVYGKGQIR